MLRSGAVNFASKDDVYLNAPNDDGNTPLHLAIKRGAHVDTVKLLVEQGAGVNTPDKDGHTPLDLASTKGID